MAPDALRPPALAAGEAALPGVEPAAGAEIALDQDPGSQAIVAADGARTSIDVVFPVMHGPYGEDGSIQGPFEMAGVPYVGSGVLGSAVGMDKAVQAVLFEAAGIPVVPHEVVHEREEEDPEAVEARAQHLGYLMFAGRARLVDRDPKVDGPDELRGALEDAFRYGRKAVLERSMDRARELEVSVLGNDDLVASVAGEIVPRGHDFYDYEAKYLDEHGAELVIPADVPARCSRSSSAWSPRSARSMRDGPDGLLPVGRGPPVPERGQHDPGVHEHLDVPGRSGMPRGCPTPSSWTG